MNNEQLLTVLGLTSGASTTEIDAAFKTKITELNDKLTSAPTDALKQKFQTLINDLTKAKNNMTDKPKSRSPLSDTKMADLPGMGAAAGNAISLEEGTTLAGRYQIKEQIGVGGMGAVYRAHDRNTGKDIAVKVLLPELLKHERARERFLDEARISQQLSHPNIVNVFDVQQDGDFYFLTMELLEGQDLRQVMDNQKHARQPFDIQEVQTIIKAVSDGLAYAHQHTVHRDIKPENIWLTEQGEYKVMDFGIAQVQSTSQRTQTGAAMGTAYYMAPEQLKGQSDIDGRADQYALAVLAYELLSGEVPAGMIEPIQQHRKDIPKGMAQAIHQALSPRPENRFENINAFSEAMQSTSKGVNLPSLPIKTVGIAAGIILMVGVIGSLFSSLDFSGLIPESAEVVAQRKAEVAKLQGEIKTYKRRLDNGRRNLDSDIRDAKRESSKKLKALEYWQRLTENYIFNGSVLTDLEGELSMGESLLREKSFTPANETLTKVRDGYKNLWEQFSAAEKLYVADKENKQVYKRWMKQKSKYKLDDPVEVAQAKKSEVDAKEAAGDSNFVKAFTYTEQAKTGWKKTLSSVSGIVKKVDAENRRIKKEKALAAANAKRARLAKEKKKRISIIEKELLAKLVELNAILNSSSLRVVKGSTSTKEGITTYSDETKYEYKQLISYDENSLKLIFKNNMKYAGVQKETRSYSDSSFRIKAKRKTGTGKCLASMALKDFYRYRFYDSFQYSAYAGGEIRDDKRFYFTLKYNVCEYNRRSRMEEITRRGKYLGDEKIGESESNDFIYNVKSNEIYDFKRKWKKLQTISRRLSSEL